MKTSFSAAILLSFLWSLDLNPALAQPAPAPVLTDRNETPQLPGVLPTPSADEPIGVPTADKRFGGGGGGIGGGQGVGVFDIPRVYGSGAGGGGGGGAGQIAANYSADTKAYGYHAAAAAAIIQFSQPDLQSVDTLLEDLHVMSLLLRKKIESALGENSPTYRMGIPLLVRAGQLGIESLFLEGFGAVFTMNVNFPLVPPPASKPKESNNTTGSDEWDRARRELYVGRETDEPLNAYGTGALPYDAEQVDALKRALLDSLKNAANIRGLNPDEWIVVTVFGTESVEVGPPAGGFGRGAGGAGRTTGWPGGRGSPETAATGMGSSWSVRSGGSRTGRATVLTGRVRKSDADSFATGNINLDQFEQKAAIASYLGPATLGSSAFFRGGSYPNRYPMAPAAR